MRMFTAVAIALPLAFSVPLACQTDGRAPKKIAGEAERSTEDLNFLSSEYSNRLGTPVDVFWNGESRSQLYVRPLILADWDTFASELSNSPTNKPIEIGLSLRFWSKGFQEEITAAANGQDLAVIPFVAWEIRAHIGDEWHVLTSDGLDGLRIDFTRPLQRSAPSECRVRVTGMRDELEEFLRVGRENPRQVLVGDLYCKDMRTEVVSVWANSEVAAVLEAVRRLAGDETIKDKVILRNGVERRGVHVNIPFIGSIGGSEEHHEVSKERVMKRVVSRDFFSALVENLAVSHRIGIRWSAESQTERVQAARTVLADAMNGFFDSADRVRFRSTADAAYQEGSKQLAYCTIRDEQASKLKGVLDLSRSSKSKSSEDEAEDAQSTKGELESDSKGLAILPTSVDLRIIDLAKFEKTLLMRYDDIRALGPILVQHSFTHGAWIDPKPTVFEFEIKPSVTAHGHHLLSLTGANAREVAHKGGTFDNTGKFGVWAVDRSGVYRIQWGVGVHREHKYRGIHISRFRKGEGEGWGDILVEGASSSDSAEVELQAGDLLRVSIIAFNGTVIDGGHLTVTLRPDRR